MSNSERTIYLIDRYVDDTATMTEREELSLLLEDPSCDEAAKIYLLQMLHATQSVPEHSPARWEEIRKAIGQEQPLGSRRRMAGYRFWWSVAALLVGLLVSFYFYQQRAGLAPAHSGQTLANDRAPGGNIATLTLSDGSTIALDTVHNGTLAQQGTTSIAKLGNGQLAYKQLHEKPGTVLFNTLTTPRGGQYRLVLPDGTGVWLNAASSITYPTAFAGTDRKVSITGEAYFEVTKDAAMPFVVAIVAPAGGRDGLQVEVLGTSFNVNAYSDEDAVRTTLLEGSVRLVSPRRGTLLVPGQQGQLHRDGDLLVVSDVDTDETMAWKEGRFSFENADIATVMRQIARWYDVDVVFEGKIAAERFTGEIPRSSKLAEVFKILELSNVHCRIDNRKVTVMP